MYKKWAGQITTIVESSPTIRSRLRELIRALAEQDEAYRANEAAGPFDDPCDMLTYRIPGTIITRLDAREHVDLTALPALESEQAERQRQAVILVGIHDHSGAVKISTGIWPPELLDRVWQRLQSDPPNGPCDTVIRKALAWLRGLTSEASRADSLRAHAVPDAPPQKAGCTHTTDFTSVQWYGEEFRFNEMQAKCVKVLWTEWERSAGGTPTVHQRTIRDQVESENADFRLIYVFRRRSNGHQITHPAWGTMIQSAGNGRFYLGDPVTATRCKRVQSRRKSEGCK